MTDKKKGRKLKKKEPKRITVSRKTMKQIKMLPRVEMLEKAVKQLQGTAQMLLEHLEASRQLNAHYLVSINTLAKVAVERGLCDESFLNETRVEVVADTDFEKRKYSWVESAVVQEKDTDSWFFWDFEFKVELGHFFSKEDAEGDASKYLMRIETDRLTTMRKPRPKLMDDRLLSLERLVKVEVLKNVVERGSSIPKKASERASLGLVPSTKPGQGNEGESSPTDDVAKVT